MLPLEFTIDGPPWSHQTRDRVRLRSWRSAVRAAAARAWSGVPPVVGPVRLLVAYFHDGPTVALDGDNMAKPIQDAMSGLIYVDDRQVTQVEVRKSDINGTFYVRGLSPVLLSGFAVGRPFLYICVDVAADPARLPR